MSTTQSIFVIFAASFCAPLIADFARRKVLLPVAVVEITLGIIIGPQLLDFARTDVVINALSEFGLVMLFFLAGFEIDIAKIRGRPLNLGGLGWIASLVLALVAAMALIALGVDAPLEYLALAVATTAIGTLLPMLRDAGEMETPFGRYIVAAGAIGEFGPIVLIALFLGQEHSRETTAILLNAFVAIALLAIYLARHWQPPRVVRVVQESLHSSSQLAVRLAAVQVAFLVFLAAEFGLDILLGAFAAGAIIAQSARIAHRDNPELLELVQAKYIGIGFGFFIPIFFIVTGIRFDVDALFSSPTALALVPAFLLVFLFVRGLPAMFIYRSVFSPRDCLTLGLLSATELPLVIAVTSIGLTTGNLSAEIAAAMLGSAMLSVFLFPTIALALRKGVVTEPPSAIEEVLAEVG